MAYESYKISLPSSTSVKNRMLSEKKRQIHYLYDQAMDREEDTLLNGNPFTKSPRIFDRKFVDTFHHKITVETILDEDWIECGDYLAYENMMWLCLNSYSFHKLYCRATFMSCDWKIYWIDENGELKSQYVIDQNSTQYNSGETGGSTMTLGSAQHMLKMQCNNDTIILDSPMRFAIDKNIKKPTCYKVTQNDNSAYNYGKGLCCITVMETSLDNSVDKLITLEDGKKVWVCDYVENTTFQPSSPDSNETTNLTSMISGNNNLRNGYERTYTVTFMNENTDIIDYNKINYEWKIISDFDIKHIVNDNKITVSVNNENLIGGSFLLQIIVNDLVLSEIKINIVE